MGEIADDIIDRGWDLDVNDDFEGFEDDYVPGRLPRIRVDLDDVVVEGNFVHSTAKAILWRPTGKEPEWFPRTHIRSQNETSITVTGWIAQQKGISDMDLDDEIPF